MMMSEPSHTSLHFSDMKEEAAVDSPDEVQGEDNTKEAIKKNRTKGKLKTNIEKGYPCEECGLLSKTLANLKKHMLTHSGERPYKCATCPKAFRQHHHLADHQRTHTGERPFRCDKCGARFVQKSSLNLHKKKHSGIKPYTCSVCGHSTYEKMHLKVHMRTHTGEKPYQCEKCGQTFSNSTRLNFHQMIHTGERRYKCEECGVHFREKVTLQQHRGVHVNLGPFVCTECGQEFSRLAGLSLHRKVHTRKDDYLYVYNKEANEAFKSATLSRSTEPTETQKQISCGAETADTLTNLNEDISNSTDEIQKDPDIEQEKSRLSEAVIDNDLPCKSKTTTISLSSGDNNCSPSKGKQSLNTSDLNLQRVKENLVSNVSKNNMFSISSDIHPDQVRAALESGKIVETQDEEGKGFYIVLPPALKNEEIVLMSGSAQLKNSVLSDSINSSSPVVAVTENRTVVDNSQSTRVCTRNISIIHEKTQTVISEEELQGGDLCVELHEEVSVEPSNFSMEVNKDLQDSNPDSSQTVYPAEMEGEILGDMGRYLQVRKEIHPDGSSLFLWNDGLEHLNEVTYIIDEGSDNPIMIQSQEVLDTPTFIKPKKRKVTLDKGWKQKKQRLEHNNSSVQIKEKSKKRKEKKVRIQKVYDCEQCGKACRTSSNYISHMRTHSGERPYFCDFCGLGFKQIAHLRSHVRIHTGERPYVCDICCAAFTQSSRLNSHKKSMHTGTNTEVRKNIKKREKIVSEQKVRNFYCKVCKKTFINECYKIDHMRSHMNSKCFECKICGIQYKTKVSLLKHRLTHSDHKCICEMCGMGFLDLTSLHNHRISEHDKSATESGMSDVCISVKIGEEQDFVVINPSMKDSSKEEDAVKDTTEAGNRQVRHNVLHITEEDGHIRNQIVPGSDLDEVKIKCEAVTEADDFGMTTLDKNKSLEMESTVMEIVKHDPLFSDNDASSRENIVQNEIATAFQPSKSLDKLKVKDDDVKMWSTFFDDSGRKIWFCEVCNRSFLQSSNLHCHMRMHTGERPYKCNVCSVAFRQITHLKDHMSRHTGIRPYQCSGCGSSFSQRSAVTRHIKFTHNGNDKIVVLKNTQSLVDGKENEKQNKKLGTYTTSGKCLKRNVDGNSTSTSVCMKTCEICKKSYSATYIKTHIRFHTGKRPYKCKLCKEAFKQKAHLQSHMHLHSKRKIQFVCSCGATFTSLVRLNNHNKKCVGYQETINQDTKVCNCGADFCSVCQMSKQVKTYNNINDSCDQSTDESESYISFDDESDDDLDSEKQKNETVNKKTNESKGNVSLKPASKEFRYTCTACLEPYHNFSLYKTHILIHGNHLREVCRDCGAVFRRASALKFHQSVKHGRRDERYKEYSTAEDGGNGEELSDESRFSESELKLENVDCETSEKTDETILNGSGKQKKGLLKLSSLTNKMKKKLSRTTTKTDCETPACTLNEHETMMENIPNNKKKKPKPQSSLKPCTAHNKEFGDANDPSRTKEDKVSDTKIRGDYTCETCKMVFTRHSKLRSHVAMWCKKQKESSPVTDSSISGQCQSPDENISQIIQEEIKSKKKKKSVHDAISYQVSSSCDQELSKANDDTEFHHFDSDNAMKKRDLEEREYVESHKVGTFLLSEEKEKLRASIKRNIQDNILYCILCNKHYKKVNSYKVHMLTHLNERPFKCDRCPQAFNQTAHLTSHYRRHTGERPYKCPQCPRAFTQPHNLKYHKRKLHCN